MKGGKLENGFKTEIFQENNMLEKKSPVEYIYSPQSQAVFAVYAAHRGTQCTALVSFDILLPGSVDLRGDPLLLSLILHPSQLPCSLRFDSDRHLLYVSYSAKRGLSNEVLTKSCSLLPFMKDIVK